MKNKTAKRWCTKHQVVHCDHTIYWSCRFPNDPEMNGKLKENRKLTKDWDE